MPSFSAASEQKLRQCDPRLQAVMREVVKHFDCTILEGHRSKEAQEAAFTAGNTKLHWPNGKHNSLPSKAVDAAPYPVEWTDRERMSYFAGWVVATARTMGLTLRWGGDWSMDTQVRDNTFDDLVHFEIVE